MQAIPEFGFQQLITELLRGVADTVADRPGETEAQRFARHQTAVFSVMAFMPRDAIEIMLAGQCVMLDHLLRDATRDLLRSEAGPGKLRIRSQVTALGRSFLKHLEQFYQQQVRPEQQTAGPPRAEPEQSPNPDHLPEPNRQTTKAAAGQPAEAATEAAEAVSVSAQSSAAGDALGFAAPQAGKAAPLLQRGFQNRRMRRALQFKKPPGKASSGGATQMAVAPQSAPGSAPAQGS